MAKYLKDILKQAHDTIKGVRPSETGQLSIGKDPGVDYKPKAADEADFIAKHSVQKWDDVAGNPNFADKVSHSLDKEKNHGNTLAKAKAANEEFEIDEAMSLKQKQYSNRVKTMPGKKGAVMTDKSNFEAPFHKVHATISKNGGAKETVKHEIKAKDKHDAIFDVQMMHHKAGHKVHDVKHKGMVKEDTEVSESKKTEDVLCNSTSAGTECPVHGIAECMSASPLKELSKKTLGGYVQGATRDALSKQYALGKGEKVDTRKLMNRRKGIDKAVDKMANEEVEQIDELSTDLLHRAAHKAAKVAMTDVQGRSGPIFKKRAAQANKFRAKGMEQEKKERAMKEEALDEVLTKSTTAGETIHDFVHSDNPKFAGKSKEKRKEMALAAYYAKQREQKEEVEIEENGPVASGPQHLDAQGIAKKYKDYVTGGGSSDTASRYKSHVNMHAKKTGQDPDAINKEIKKHVMAMKEDIAVPLLGGDHPPRGDSDEAIEMVKAELKALANKAMHLVMQMPDGMHVEPWCQAKIAQAKSYVSDVHDYMIYGDHDKQDEEDEQTDTPLTLPNMSVDVNTGQNV
jgi:hypothetical protein